MTYFHRTQNLLIKTNLEKMSSLGLAFYCFGHEAKTAVEQEIAWAGISLIKGVLEKHFPQHIDLKPLSYDSFFRPGWATSNEAEERHKVKI